jgi:hypothetical protein
MTIDLLDSDEGQVVWSASHDVDRESLAAAQRALVERIAGSLQALQPDLPLAHLALSEAQGVGGAFDASLASASHCLRRPACEVCGPPEYQRRCAPSGLEVIQCPLAGGPPAPAPGRVLEGTRGCFRVSEANRQ